MYTVITKGNEVSQHISIDSIERSVEGPFLAIGNCNGSKVAFTEISPITWPTDASDGMQAIVDVKAGTLRFGYYDGRSWAVNEFVVSEYVEPASRAATREEVMELVDTWPIHLERNGEEITKDWAWGGVNGITAIVNQSTGETITENDWREYLVEILRKNPAVETVTAASMLTAALGHMEDRAKTYDTPGGERSMGKTVAAFNVITGHTLTEEAGWLFMEILKQVRSQQGDYRADNYEDMVAYAALRGECAARERGNK